MQQDIESALDLWLVHVMDTIWRQKTGSTSTLSYQSYFDLLKSAAYCHDITANLAMKECQAYTHLSQDDNDPSPGLIDIDSDHVEDNTTNYQAYLMNLSSPSPSHTSKVFLPKSIWSELTDKVKKLIIAHSKYVAHSSPLSQAPSSSPSSTPPIGSKPVIRQVKAHDMDEPSDTHHDPLLAMVHDSLNQPEITDSSDIAQLLSINKANTQKDPQYTAKAHK